jgi:hypothetical protein
MGMDMDPVSYTADLGISNFHILELNVPDFDAGMELTGGAQFYAKVMPYVGVGVNFSDLFVAMGGLEGQAGVEIDLDIGMGGRVYGENDQYGGELSMGATVTPSATLALVAFAEWGVPSIGVGDRYEWEAFSHTFSDLFQFSWEKTYEFGDVGPRNRDGAQNTTASTPSTGETLTQNPQVAGPDVDPDLGVGNNVGARSGPEGGPQIAGSDQESGDQESSSTPSRIEEARRKAEILSRGVQGLLRIVSILPNPARAVVDVVLNFDELKTAVDDVITCIEEVRDMLAPLLPGWWETLKGWIADGVDALARGAGMVLDAGRWAINTVGDALSDGFSFINPFD